MPFSKFATFASTIAFASKAAAHGTVQGLVADGVYYQGYNANFQYMQDAPVVVGWSTPENQGNGPITPDAYADQDIICHLGATNAKTSAKVAAGGVVELHWTAWPESHHGPVLDYLAKCSNDDCTTVDKMTLEFFKIDGEGIVDGTSPPGIWADDTLIANNNSWTVTIPTDIAPGNYVLRHEIIALHAAGETNGAQNYPQCFNLEVSGLGTAAPSGVLGTALYTATEPGILVNIYQTLTNYTVPGPALYSGAISMAPSAQSAAAGVSTVSSAAAAAITGASAPVSTSASIVAVAAETSVVAAVASSIAAGITAPARSQPSGISGTAPASKKSKSACKVKSAKPSKSACKAKTNRASATQSADATPILARRQHVRDIIPHMAHQEQDGTAHASGHYYGHGVGHVKPTGTVTRGEKSYGTGVSGSRSNGSFTEGRAQPTGSFNLENRQDAEESIASSSSTQATGKPNRGHGRPHRTSVAGSKPTGSFSAGSAQPTGKAQRSGFFDAKPTGTRAAGSAQPSGFGGRFRKGAFTRTSN